jgi:hypothetical protein
MEPTKVIAQVCEELTSGDFKSAAVTINEQYPFAPLEAVERKYGAAEALGVFIRDGFIDRYSGRRLVFTGALRLIAHLLPREFPYHPNWKMSVTHPAFWHLTPTVDHRLPVCRGGADAEDNWLTTSMLRNSAKANWTLEELGWTLHPAGELADWDGQLSWFESYVAATPAVLQELPALRVWQRAALAKNVR